MKHAHFDCVSGVAGDMTLAALISAGWPESELQALPARLGLAGVTIVVSRVQRGPFAAVHVDVQTTETQPHRHLHHIEAILDAADLPTGVRDRAKAVFLKLAEAEAEVHGSTVKKVHFHEVGAVDAIVDIAGSILGLDALGVSRVSASVLPLGRGSVDSQHGRIPVPAPATALLLRGVPVVGGPVEGELVTPTGAALLVVLATSWGDPPAMRLGQVGTGAGTKQFPAHPNILRLLIGESIEDSYSYKGVRTVSVLETALDDANPQHVAATMKALLAAGALDAMVAPVTMKKGRAGSWLVVVAEPADAPRLAERIMRELPTLGVRVRDDRRFELPRRTDEVETRFGRVRLKIAMVAEGVERAVPEFDSVQEVAALAGVTLAEVSAEAIAVHRTGSRPRD